MDEMTALAAAAAATVVGAMATDTWTGVRDAVVALFRRREGDGVVEAQLERHAELVTKARLQGVARQELLGTWVLELASLLEQDPTSGIILRRLVADYGSAPADAADRRSFVQHNTATGSGSVIGVQAGNLYADRGSLRREQQGTDANEDSAGGP